MGLDHIRCKSEEDRNENDLYPTAPLATYALTRLHDVPENIWEPAAGPGWMSNELKRLGHTVFASDLFDYPGSGTQSGRDFLEGEKALWVDGVVTNPPYKNQMPAKFVRRTLEDHGMKFLALFVRQSFFESKGRYELFGEFPPSHIYISSDRLNCDSELFIEDIYKKQKGGMIAYAWFVWDYRYVSPKDTRTKIKWFRLNCLYPEWIAANPNWYEENEDFVKRVVDSHKEL